jgi:hypothetical protein
LLVLSATLAVAGPALARDIRMPKMSAAELKGVCDKVGGKFSQDPQHYGCGTDCNGAAGTDCIVSCAADGNCLAQVIGARRPHNVTDALVTPTRHAR